MPWKSLSDVPASVRGLGLAKANHWGRIYDAVKAGGADDASAAAIAWTQLKKGAGKKNPVRVEGFTARGGARLDDMRSMCPTWTDPEIVVEEGRQLTEGGRRNSAADRARIETVVRAGLDQMDDQHHDSFLAGVKTRRRSLVLNPTAAHEARTAPSLSATMGRARGSGSHDGLAPAGRSALLDELRPPPRTASFEEREVSAILRGQVRGPQDLAEHVAEVARILNAVGRNGVMVEGQRLARSCTALMAAHKEMRELLQPVVNLVLQGYRRLPEDLAAALLELGQGLAETLEPPPAARRMTEAKKKAAAADDENDPNETEPDGDPDDRTGPKKANTIPAKIAAKTKKTTTGTQGNDPKSSDEAVAAVGRNIAVVLEAAKKRIKGNLCTGSGGFQACNTTAGMSRSEIVARNRDTEKRFPRGTGAFQRGKEAGQNALMAAHRMNLPNKTGPATWLMKGITKGDHAGIAQSADARKSAHQAVQGVVDKYLRAKSSAEKFHGLLAKGVSRSDAIAKMVKARAKNRF